MIEAGIALGVALIGLWLGWLRPRLAARRADRHVGQAPELLPPGTYAVWPMRYLLAASTPSLLRVDGASMELTPPAAVQPTWRMPANRVRVQVLPRSRWVDVTRLRLEPQGEKPLVVRISRETRRPLGALDPPYEERLAGYLASFVDDARRAGAPVGRR